MSETNRPDEPVRIEYRPDGKIPVGIWLVWLGFAVWGIWYSIKYAIPDLMLWLRQT